MTYYEVLGVPARASAAEVRQAYLALARKNHPDFHVNADPRQRRDAEQAMRRINEAWTVLSDPARRLAYDHTLETPSSSAQQWRPGMGTAHPDFVPVDSLDADEGEPEVDAGAGIPVSRWIQFLPIALLSAAFATVALGLVVALPPVAGLGLLLLVASGVAFVLTPMLAMRSGYHPPDGHVPRSHPRRAPGGGSH